MAIRYFRRFRMEISLTGKRLPQPQLPDGFQWLIWHPVNLERHAEIKYQSFRGEIDAEVFESLSTRNGCLRLMREIVAQRAFLPAATWLAATTPNDAGQVEDCATIQGLRRSRKGAAIQNVGVAPAFRGLGLGRAIVLQALHGFRSQGIKRVSLEVTAENRPAVALYRSLGFKLRRTTFKAVAMPEAQPATLLQAAAG